MLARSPPTPLNPVRGRLWSSWCCSWRLRAQGSSSNASAHRGRSSWAQPRPPPARLGRHPSRSPRLPPGRRSVALRPRRTATPAGARGSRPPRAPSAPPSRRRGNFLQRAAESARESLQPRSPPPMPATSAPGPAQLPGRSGRGTRGPRLRRPFWPPPGGGASWSGGALTPRACWTESGGALRPR
jgi:hypothetical protein